jgi:hypothetical protein
MARNAIVRSKGGIPELLFQLYVRNDNRKGMPPLVTLKAHYGPGDAGETIINILKPPEA